MVRTIVVLMILCGFVIEAFAQALPQGKKNCAAPSVGDMAAHVDSAGNPEDETLLDRTSAHEGSQVWTWRKGATAKILETKEVRRLKWANVRLESVKKEGWVLFGFLCRVDSSGVTPAAKAPQAVPSEVKPPPSAGFFPAKDAAAAKNPSPRESARGGQTAPVPDLLKKALAGAGLSVPVAAKTAAVPATKTRQALPQKLAIPEDKAGKPVVAVKPPMVAAKPTKADPPKKQETAALLPRKKEIPRKKKPVIASATVKEKRGGKSTPWIVATAKPADSPTVFKPERNSLYAVVVNGGVETLVRVGTLSSAKRDVAYEMRTLDGVTYLVETKLKPAR